MIEVMIAVLLTAVAVIGIVGLYRIQARSSGYSRRSTEAAVLCADKMETLRTETPPASSGADEVVDSQGIPVAGAPYTRRWIVTPSATDYKLEVQVDWDDDGVTRTTTLVSIRGLN